MSAMLVNDESLRIRRFLKPEERLILLADSDLDLDGRFGRSWLAVTEQRVMSFSDDSQAAGPLVEVRLADVKTVRSMHMVGRVALQAEVGGRKLGLLYYSNSHAEKFARILKGLNDACKDHKPPEFDLSDLDVRKCPKCGRLLPEKGGFCPGCLKKRRVIGRFWKYLRPHWPLALLVSILIVMGATLSLAPPLFVEALMDKVFLGKGGVRLLLALVVGLVFTKIASLAMDVSKGRLSVKLGARVAHEVRVDFYDAVQGLSLRRHDKVTTGALISRLTGDARMLNYMLADMPTWFFPAVLELVGICIVLFVMNWKLALLVLIPAPVVVIFTLWLYRRLHGRWHRLYQRHAKMTARATDSITGIRIVKAFAQEPTEIGHFRLRSAAFRDATVSAEGAVSTYFPILTFITTLGTFLVWFFGGLQLLEAKGNPGPPSMTIGKFTAYLFYLGMFYGPLQMLTNASQSINRSFTAAQRLFEIMDADQEVYEAPHARPLEHVKGAFRFENVHFGYVPDSPVLKGIDIEVKPGEMIGLVGRSGVGKTTIINLICRFYDVDEGRITLDGVDLRDIKLRDLRRHIGIVPQDPFLFNASIAENIAYGKPEVSREDIIRAAIVANAHGFIMRFPDGYDTRIGERGARLSAGERQRIAIARAILNDPGILILDEATSSVDTETEQLIQEALERLVKGRTTFAIAHRLSTLKNASRLLVLDEGKVKEFGTHDELMAKKGLYHRLVEMQSKMSAIKAVDG